MLVSLGPSWEALGEAEAQEIPRTLRRETRAGQLHKPPRSPGKVPGAESGRGRRQPSSGLPARPQAPRPPPDASADVFLEAPAPSFLAPPRPAPTARPRPASRPPAPLPARPRAAGPAARRRARPQRRSAARPGRRPALACRRSFLARPAAAPTGPATARLSPVRPPPLPWPRRRCSTKKGLARSVTHSALATSTSSGPSHIAAPRSPGRRGPGGSAAVAASRSRAGGAGRAGRRRPLAAAGAAGPRGSRRVPLSPPARRTGEPGLLRFPLGLLAAGLRAAGSSRSGFSPGANGLWPEWLSSQVAGRLAFCKNLSRVCRENVKE